MDLATIIIVLIAAALGVAVGYLLAKGKKTSVGYSEEQYGTIQRELEAVKTSAAVLKSQNEKLDEAYSLAKTDLKELNTQLSDTQAARSSLLTENKGIQQNLAAAQTQITSLEAKLTESTSLLQDARQLIAKLKSEIEGKDKRLLEQKKDLEEIGTKLKNEFKLIAGDILNSSSKQLNEQQEANLKNILTPFKENINKFQQEISSRYNDETKERATLKAEIKQMMEMSSQLSKDADNLSNALRGNTKHQGDWGEAILERILDYVGLKKDIHYTTQETGTNDEGSRVRPDVLVKYPDDRVLVIDSKVSLVHYERYCNTNDEVEQKQHLQMLVSSFKGHIDSLKSKQYDNLPGALDSVMMFVPVEPAFITAQQADQSLWQYAYDRGIIMLSPTILLGAMKLVYDYWKRDEVTKNAQEIADRAGKMYDKFTAFVSDMESIGSYLQKAQLGWEKGYNKLTDGRANLISQATQMKKLGIKAKKELPETLVHTGLLEDGIEVEDVDSEDDK